MQHRVAEHGVELLVERERLGAAAPRIEPAGARGANLLGAAVDGDDAAAGRDQLFGQRAVAQPRSSTCSPGARGEQFENAGAEIGDETRVPGIRVRVPVLCGHVNGVRGGTVCAGRRRPLAGELLGFFPGAARACHRNVKDMCAERGRGCSISFAGARGIIPRSIACHRMTG